jgi:hypothetical protein
MAINNAQKLAISNRLMDMLDDYQDQANDSEDDGVELPDNERIADFLLYYSMHEDFADFIKR